MAPNMLKKLLLKTIVTQYFILISLSMQLQQIVQTYFMHQRRIIDAILAISLRKKNHFVRKMGLMRLKRLQHRPRSVWFKDGGNDTFWQNLVNGKHGDEKWKKNFRLTKEKFYELVDMLRPYISPDDTSPNHRKLDADKKLAVCLYYLKDTGSMWMTANTFGIHQTTVSKIVFDICDAITRKLGPRFLYMPRTEDEVKQKATCMEMKFGMPQALGSIDGTHIPIIRPSQASQDFFNYKHFFSLSVQAVCDFRGIFMDVDCRRPGSLHDAKTFANSKVRKNMSSNKIPITYHTLLPGRSKVPNYLIGDPAYPLTPYCMKEYTSCNTNAQVIFNNMLRSARNQVECAFGRLKARWSILTKPIDIKLTHIPTIVYACFVLHNFCEMSDLTIEQDVLRAHITEIHEKDDSRANEADSIYSCNTDEGGLVREVITDYMRYCLPDHL